VSPFILASVQAAQDLATQSAAVDWVGNAYAHLKIIGHATGSQPLLDRAGVQPGAGVLAPIETKSVRIFIQAAKNGRVWDRESSLRRPG
jgi:catalase